MASDKSLKNVGAHVHKHKSWDPCTEHIWYPSEVKKGQRWWRIVVEKDNAGPVPHIGHTYCEYSILIGIDTKPTVTHTDFTVDQADTHVKIMWVVQVEEHQCCEHLQTEFVKDMSHCYWLVFAVTGMVSGPSVRKVVQKLIVLMLLVKFVDGLKPLLSQAQYWSSVP